MNRLVKKTAEKSVTQGDGRTEGNRVISRLVSGENLPEVAGRYTDREKAGTSFFKNCECKSFVNRPWNIRRCNIRMEDNK